MLKNYQFPYLADLLADIYQWVGRQRWIRDKYQEYLLDLFCYLCWLFDVQKPKNKKYLNPAMLRGIFRAANISVEDFLKLHKK